MDGIFIEYILCILTENLDKPVSMEAVLGCSHGGYAITEICYL